MQIVSNGDDLHEMSNPVFSNGDNLHEMSNPVFRENKKNISSPFVEYAQGVVKVNFSEW